MNTFRIDEVKRSLAILQKENDFLFELLMEADQTLRSIGFKEGLESFKSTARELIRSDRIKSHG